MGLGFRVLTLNRDPAGLGSAASGPLDPKSCGNCKLQVPGLSWCNRENKQHTYKYKDLYLYLDINIYIYIYSYISVRIYVHVDTISIFTYVHKRIDGKREAET